MVSYVFVEEKCDEHNAIIHLKYHTNSNERSQPLKKLKTIPTTLHIFKYTVSKNIEYVFLTWSVTSKSDYAILKMANTLTIFRQGYNSPKTFK